LPEATYSLGPPQRPPLQWDDVSTSIPKHSPTSADYLLLAKWNAELEAGEAIQDTGLPHSSLADALGAYRHYLKGKGADRTFSYERYVTNDPSGKTTLDNAILDIEDGAQQLYAANFAGKPAQFKITGTAIPCERRHAVKFPYPRTENWQKAIGYHNIWLSGDVTVTPLGSQPNFSMAMTLHAEDKYNFNPGQADIATGTPYSENAELEAAGLANSYMHYSTLQRTVRWTTVGPPQIGQTDQSRVRQPQDNVRIRNRL
jgi:hypothetical protein